MPDAVTTLTPTPLSESHTTYEGSPQLRHHVYEGDYCSSDAQDYPSLLGVLLLEHPFKEWATIPQANSFMKVIHLMNQN